MKTGAQVAWAKIEDPIKQVIIGMTEHPVGAACVVADDGRLVGLVTDGDLRRALQLHEDIRGLRAGEVMTRNPVTVPAEATLHEALQLMENRPSQISVLPVVEPSTHRCLGLLRLHDVYHAAL
jgi:arabinose-5-phosphate isomerase